MFFCVGTPACLCSVAENALVDFSLGKQRDRKSTAQKVEERGEERENELPLATFPHRQKKRQTASESGGRAKQEQREEGI